MSVAAEDVLLIVEIFMVGLAGGAGIVAVLWLAVEEREAFRQRRSPPSENVK